MTITANGKELAEKIYENIKSEINRLGTTPTLAIILTEDNESGKIYVGNKQKSAEKTGIKVKLNTFAADVKESELLNTIQTLNADKSTDAILVQLPLPAHIDKQKVLNAVSPEKDADGFHYVNAGKMFTGQMPYTIACTPKGIIRLLDEYNINPEGMSALVIGRSDIVGKPISQLLMQRNATVTVAHGKTRNLKELTKRADIIVSAAGSPGLVRGEDVKDGVVVIDVGISRVNGKLKGDIDFETVSPKAKLITPVPGGVGPMTVAMLAENTLHLHKLHNQSAS